MRHKFVEISIVLLKTKMKFMLMICLSSSIFGGAAHAANIPSLKSGNINVLCNEEWTKRGVLDQNMYQFCMKTQREGYESLKSLVSKYASQQWLQAAIDYSIEEWTKRDVTNFSMVHFTLNQITEGYEDIIYLSKQPTWQPAKYERCLQEWEIRLQMVVHCYKK